jgi:hypothetical protein
MRIPILSGIYTDAGGNVRADYPLNYLPIPGSNGVSDGFMRPADGIVQKITGPGKCRGGIVWNGVQYRVLGTKLCSVTASTVTELGDIPGSGLVSIDYSFERLSISNGSALYYFDGATVTQVTDADLGQCVDHIFLDGYTVSTDGEFVVVSELQDPTSFNPLKYGSSELDPDDVVALRRPRRELHVVNRFTIEVFANVGGSFFPFSRIKGAQIMKGAVGTHACCEFLDAVAFVGSGRNESVGVYIGANSQTVKISTREIDKVLAGMTDAQLAQAVLQARVGNGQEILYLHVGNKSFAYEAAMSRAVREPAWVELQSGFTPAMYKACTPVWFNGEWWVGHPETNQVGVLSEDVSTHWGEAVPWEFSTAMVFNENKGGLVHDLELVALPGRCALGANPMISASYSLDGRTFSQQKPIRAGKIGDSLKRLVWWGAGMFKQYRIQRFSGTSDAHLTVLRLDANIEPLAY